MRIMPTFARACCREASYGWQAIVPAVTLAKAGVPCKRLTDRQSFWYSVERLVVGGWWLVVGRAAARR